ncbi:hypothetical protein [Streptomyces ambofaciens]|uniref:hypothetical protein n=1 Tax=Streptomyces ambofaciens TaxID=1889 RepID=UPI000AC6E070|nr:hypothetical protein [Streptomyces ambofaciens]
MRARARLPVREAGTRRVTSFLGDHQAENFRTSKRIKLQDTHSRLPGPASG